MSRLGVPTKGSKNAIAKWVVEQLPSAESFVDIFCGGCSITHAALLSGKYKSFIINDIDERMPQFFIDSIYGKYTTQNQTEWISREDFFRRIDEPYISCCWSFGNDGVTYIGLFANFGIDVPTFDGIEGAFERYRKYKMFFRDKMNTLTSLESLSRLKNIERIQSLQSLQSLQSFVLDYQEVEIPDDAIIYADPPYANTKCGRYSGFDYKRFYEWADEQQNIFISEYWMPDNFIPYSYVDKVVLSAAKTNSIYAREMIYTNRRTFERLSDKSKELVWLSFAEQISLF